MEVMCMLIRIQWFSKEQWYKQVNSLILKQVQVLNNEIPFFDKEAIDPI